MIFLPVSQHTANRKSRCATDEVHDHNLLTSELKEKDVKLKILIEVN
jgi:hypothetical protein